MYFDQYEWKYKTKLTSKERNASYLKKEYESWVKDLGLHAQITTDILYMMMHSKKDIDFHKLITNNPKTHNIDYDSKTIKFYRPKDIRVLRFLLELGDEDDVTVKYTEHTDYGLCTFVTDNVPRIYKQAAEVQLNLFKLIRMKEYGGFYETTPQHQYYVASLLFFEPHLANCSLNWFKLPNSDKLFRLVDYNIANEYDKNDYNTLVVVYSNGKFSHIKYHENHETFGRLSQCIKKTENNYMGWSQYDVYKDRTSMFKNSYKYFGDLVPSEHEYNDYAKTINRDELGSDCWYEPKQIFKLAEPVENTDKNNTIEEIHYENLSDGFEKLYDIDSYEVDNSFYPPLHKISKHDKTYYFRSPQHRQHIFKKDVVTMKVHKHAELGVDCIDPSSIKIIKPNGSIFSRLPVEDKFKEWYDDSKLLDHYDFYSNSIVKIDNLP